MPSLQATLLSNTSNILTTGLLGFALFGEQLSARWAAGVALLLAGLFLITKASTLKASEDDKKVQ